MSYAKDGIDSVLKEHRVFAPPDRFSADAFVPSRARLRNVAARSSASWLFETVDVLLI